MFTHPGTKLLFMGSEFGQYEEWNFQNSLDWNLLEFDPHSNTQKYFATLNQFYKTTPALFEKGFSGEGFEWINYEDAENSVISYLRKGNNPDDDILVVCNFTPNTYKKYKVGVPYSGKVKEIFNSDEKVFGGSGKLNSKQVRIKDQSWNNQKYTVEISIPPLGITVLEFIV